MSDHDNVVIWVDYRQAMIFQFDVAGFDRGSVRSAHPDRHIHHTLRGPKSGYLPLDKAFFKRVAEAIEHAAAIIIAGPATAKTELVDYIERTEPAIASRIAGVESLDHLTNSSLVSLARAFRDDDSMHSQSRR